MLTQSPLEHDVLRLRSLQQEGRHAEALPKALELLRTWPENRDLLLIAAIAQRHLMRIDAAMATLDRLEACKPGFSRLHQERGLCHVVRKDAPLAIASLVRAVQINPALMASWNMLAGLYRLIGDGAAAPP